jgi:hypothetical protein
MRKGKEMKDQGVVIVGGGLASQRCAETLRRRGYEGRIRMVCGEPIRPYDRPPLSKDHLAGEIADEEVSFRPADWYRDNRVELIVDRRATRLDPKRRRLELDDSTEVFYEELVIARSAMRRPESAAALCTISRKSDFVRWKLQLAVNNSPPGVSSRSARRLISLYPRIAAGTEARVLANAGGSSTIVSNDSPNALIIERVCFHERHVRDRVAHAVFAGASQCLRRHVERDDRLGAPREVKRERAVIAETVECSPAREAADEHAVLALIEKRAGLLSAPRGGENADAMLVHLDLLGHGATKQLDADRQSLLGAQGHVVPREDSVGMNELVEYADDGVTKCFESRTHELNDEPPIVTIADERWTAVALAVNQSMRGRDATERFASSDCGADAVVPPRIVERDARVAVDHAE